MSDDVKRFTDADNKRLRCIVANQREELGKLNGILARKNLQLDALHYVWCDGACEGGTHRHGGELTQEIVEEAERNTERLKRRWAGLQEKREREEQGR